MPRQAVCLGPRFPTPTSTQPSLASSNASRTTVDLCSRANSGRQAFTSRASACGTRGCESRDCLLNLGVRLYSAESIALRARTHSGTTTGSTVRLSHLLSAARVSPCRVGLIHWKIVIHAFIDGHSRFVLGLRASNNNRAETVAHLFSEIVGVYGFPSRMRGDHGVENLIVAELMEHFRGLGRGSYIWGKSVHNVRIERLWVDVVKGFVSKWKAFFQSLEINHRLRRNDRAHIALVHLLFLPCINGDAVAWMEGWNSHTFSRLPNHPRRTHLPSPRELYTLGHVEHGVRATEAVPADDIPEHELAEYGIDWEEHQDDEVMRLHWQNNNLPDVPDADRHPNGWARPPRPETLVDVRVVPPGDILSPQQVDQLYAYLVSLGLDLESTSMDVRRLWWIHALDFCERLP